jgi:hypothetical protein
MNAFETLVASCLWRDGYWVQNSVWVHLTRRDCERIKRPTIARWEIDLVAYRPGELLAVECKSYLDSPGVRFAAFNADDRNYARFSKNFKLFNDDSLRRVVLTRLRTQLCQLGTCESDVPTRLALAYGRSLNGSDKLKIARLFAKRRWRLFDDDWLRKNVRDLSASRYTDDSVALTAKLIMRKET